MQETSRGKMGAGGGASKEEEGEDTTKKEKSSYLRSGSPASREYICSIDDLMPK